MKRGLPADHSKTFDLFNMVGSIRNYPVTADQLYLVVAFVGNGYCVNESPELSR